MRCALLALAGVMMTGQAIAADYLRGSVFDAPPPVTEDFNWSGIYFGAQAGYSSANYDFSGGTHDLVARLLRQTTIENEAHVSDLASLANQDRRSGSYGAFF